MQSSGDSNSVPLQVPGSTWSSAIPVHDSSDTSGHDDEPLRFLVRLYADYRHYIVLPDVPAITGTNRWITLNTEHGRIYRIEMVEDGGGFLLDRGWPLFAAIENLQQEQTLAFQRQVEDIFDVWIHMPSHRPPPVGLSPARIPSPGNNLGPTHLVINTGTEINDIVLQAIRQVWNISSADGPIYVSRLFTNPSEDDSLIFNKMYSSFMTEDHDNITMRFIGSNIIIPGAIKTYANRRARMVKEWPVYARAHNLAIGEIFICKVHRGPAVWEFVGFCAGRQ